VQVFHFAAFAFFCGQKPDRVCGFRSSDFIRVHSAFFRQTLTGAASKMDGDAGGD